jgi:hypothetical protein
MPPPVVEGEPMNGLVRISVAVAVTSMVAFTISGCALLRPPERFSDEATVTEEIATVELDDPRGSVTVVGDDDAMEVSISRTLRYRGERPEGETHEVDGDVLVLSGCGRRCTAE